MAGFRGSVIVEVQYRYPAPSVGPAERALGGFVYPGQENPTAEDRVRGLMQQLFGGDED
jgi:hypothetical protein